MNPILLGREVAEALRDRVRNSFPVSSPAFADTIETFLTEPPEETGRGRSHARFLQGPFVSVDMPFRRADGGEPFPEVPLGFPPHLHQARAFERLRAPAPCSTLVATGTGSGKTEAYLWPILDACRARAGEKGIKAIIIYPMNALASDQARRIARAITSIPSLKDVRCGLYADAEPVQPSDHVRDGEVITRRQTMRDDPPDILLTNYRMLDLLLLRPRDRALWERNGPQTLSYLVVDELHTFDGAQGTDLALLIRRLKARLGTPEGHLACVGSSATLGADGADRLAEYAADIFGEPFDASAVITEDRQKVEEVFPPRASSRLFDNLPAPDTLAAALEEAARQNQPEAAATLAALFFPHLDVGRSLLPPSARDPSGEEWRVMLGGALKEHVATERLLASLASRKGPSTLGEIAADLAPQEVFSRAGYDEITLRHLAEALVALISWARGERPEGSSKLPPLFPVRVQFWARELGRMVATIPKAEGGRIAECARLAHSDDCDAATLTGMLPVIHCSHCGTTGHVALLPARGRSVWAPLRRLHEAYFGGDQRVRFIYHDPVARPAKGGKGKVIEAFLTPALDLRYAHDGPGEEPGTRPIWLYDPGDTKKDQTCPGCATPGAVQILGLRAARLTASLATTLFSSRHNEADETAKPRLLMFSDSVQDAAQRAAVAEIRNATDVKRLALLDALESAPARARPLSEIVADLPEELRIALGEETFVARHIARDQVWRDGYRSLQAGDGLDPDPLVAHVALRLGWEFFSDLTYRSNGSQTLETRRLAVAEPDPERIAAVAARLPGDLAAHVSDRIELSPDEAHAFLTGFLRQLRRRGAVGHDYLVRAVRAANDKGLGWFAARRGLGAHTTDALPIPGHGRAPRPIPVTLRQGARGLDSLNPATPNWYTAWADRFFLKALALGVYSDIFKLALGLAEREGLVETHFTDRGPGGAPPVRAYLLAPAEVVVSTDVGVLGCDACARRETVLAETLDRPVPCPRIGCTGTMRPVHAPAARPATRRRLHRVVAREHTGIIDTETRRRLETDFIEGEDAWHPNLVSATPTLEMGIDIGDLSTLILAQVPPEAANYVQRIGRSGRRDGNSLNLTLAASRPHDLEFWEWPFDMLSGQVNPPGVHLKAVAVLRRQAAAFALDRFVASGSGPQTYGRVRDVLAALGSPEAPFLSPFFRHLEQDGEAIAADFLALLPAAVREDAEIAGEIARFITAGSGGPSLRSAVLGAFEAARAERDAQMKLQADIDAERKRLRRLSPPPKDLDERLEALRAEREQISQSIRVGINDVDVLKFLTDRGLLPNYAFPEEGVKLKSIIVRRPEKGQSRPSFDPEEYVRAASSALGDFAPFQTFYANGRGITVSRIEFDRQDLAEWRFCPSCMHNARASAVLEPRCPRCGSEAWSDTGARADVVMLRTVAAVTTEQKATIRDLDERIASIHDRGMFPAYEADAIRFAFSAAQDGGGPPFGFEYVERCEFRDINFGERGAVTGQVIAGEARESEPFLMCAKCGRLQKALPESGAGKEHQARCEALRGDEPKEEWARRIYLMRAFTTEAVRVVLPVTRQADHDEVKSFVAAFDLGMRTYFRGRIDHLRTTVVKESIGSEATVQSLYLYDSVPGGSGYLRQLVEDPRILRQVFESARRRLEDCRCGEEGRNGCHRCVRGYRAQFGPGIPARDRALEFVHRVLSGWDRLVRTERVDDAIRDRVVESELEKRFVDALAARFGEGALTEKPIAGARRGWQLTIREGGEPVHWDVEAQVEIDGRVPGAPKRRVDFLLTPRGGAGKPVVVELDGWETHAATVARDVETRVLLLRTGAVSVFTLTWDDFGDKATEVSNPLAAKTLGAAFAKLLDDVWTNPAITAARHHEPAVRGLVDASHDAAGKDEPARRTGTSLGALFERLICPEDGDAHPAALVLRLAAGRGMALADVPDLSAIGDDATAFLRGAPLHVALGDASLRVIAGVPERAASADGTRAVVHADIPETCTAADEPCKERWRGMWRLLNLLQDLPGLHVSVPGAELSAPSGRREGPDPWEAIAVDLLPPADAVAAGLAAAGAPVPDGVGIDLTAGNAVAAQAELAWTDRRVGLVFAEDADLSVDGWTLVPVDVQEDAPVRHTVDALLSALQQA